MTEEEKSQIFKDYSEKVLGYIRGKGISPDDAEDLRSNIFVKFYSSLENFDPSKSAPSTWLYRITQTAVIDFFRTKKHFAELNEEMVFVYTNFDNVLTNETLTELGQALMRLDDRERALIVLVYYDGITLKEAAEKINMSYSNSKLVMKKALSQLKDFLK